MLTAMSLWIPIIRLRIEGQPWANLGPTYSEHDMQLRYAAPLLHGLICKNCQYILVYLTDSVILYEFHRLLATLVQHSMLLCVCVGPYMHLGMRCTYYTFGA